MYNYIIIYVQLYNYGFIHTILCDFFAPRNLEQMHRLRSTIYYIQTMPKQFNQQGKKTTSLVWNVHIGMYTQLHKKRSGISDHTPIITHIHVLIYLHCKCMYTLFLNFSTNLLPLVYHSSSSNNTCTWSTIAFQ